MSTLLKLLEVGTSKAQSGLFHAWKASWIMLIFAFLAGRSAGAEEKNQAVAADTKIRLTFHIFELPASVVPVPLEEPARKLLEKWRALVKREGPVKLLTAEFDVPVNGHREWSLGKTIPLEMQFQLAPSGKVLVQDDEIRFVGTKIEVEIEPAGLEKRTDPFASESASEERKAELPLNLENLILHFDLEHHFLEPRWRDFGGDPTILVQEKGIGPNVANAFVFHCHNSLKVTPGNLALVGMGSFPSSQLPPDKQGEDLRFAVFVAVENGNAPPPPPAKMKKLEAVSFSVPAQDWAKQMVLGSSAQHADLFAQIQEAVKQGKGRLESHCLLASDQHVGADVRTIQEVPSPTELEMSEDGCIPSCYDFRNVGVEFSGELNSGSEATDIHLKTLHPTGFQDSIHGPPEMKRGKYLYPFAAFDQRIHFGTISAPHSTMRMVSMSMAPEPLVDGKEARRLYVTFAKTAENEKPRKSCVVLGVGKKKGAALLLQRDPMKDEEMLAALLDLAVGGEVRLLHVGAGKALHFFDTPDLLSYHIFPLGVLPGSRELFIRCFGSEHNSDDDFSFALAAKPVTIDWSSDRVSGLRFPIFSTFYVSASEVPPGQTRLISAIQPCDALRGTAFSPDEILFVFGRGQGTDGAGQQPPQKQVESFFCTLSVTPEEGGRIQDQLAENDGGKVAADLMARVEEKDVRLKSTLMLVTEEGSSGGMRLQAEVPIPYQGEKRDWRAAECYLDSSMEVKADKWDMLISSGPLPQLSLKWLEETDPSERLEKHTGRSVLHSEDLPPLPKDGRPKILRCQPAEVSSESPEFGRWHILVGRRRG